MTDLDLNKDKAANWFRTLRDRICASFEQVELEFDGPGDAGQFIYTDWSRDGGGGGTMGQMKGRVFEKVGVNISTVHGEFSDQFATEIPGAADDPRFWASGISLVAHMANPHVPPVHMNTRMIVTTKWWFGGGADLNSIIEYDEDTAEFHAALKGACDRFNAGYYPRFKQWADEYFFLPHRNEPRGVGGIFYDRHNSGDWDRDFAFTQAVGEAFLDIYPRLVRKRWQSPVSEQDRKQQAFKRGRYVEFNLLHDRGTRFGIMTGGNSDAILMSLPPMASWD